VDIRALPESTTTQCSIAPQLSDARAHRLDLAK
jgi:hypothetical protein